MLTLQRVVLFAVCLAAFQCFLSGCGRQNSASGTAANPVQIAGAKFLKVDAKIEDFLPPDFDSSVIEASKIPSEKIPAPSSPAYAVAGRSLIAVVTEKGQGLQSTQNGVWIFDKRWKTIGQVVGLPSHSHSELTNIDALWNKAGDMLAVVVDCRIEGTDNIDIGMVDLKTRRFQCLLSFKMSAGPSVVWAGNQLFTSSDDYKNGTSWTTIVKIDPAKKQVSEMYREKMGSDSDLWIQTLLPSPNGKLIAFDRKTPWATEGAGIDVLDTQTRSVTHLTAEPHTNYSHCLGRWKDDHTLLFLRRNVLVSKWALYEVILHSSQKSKVKQ